MPPEQPEGAVQEPAQRQQQRGDVIVRDGCSLAAAAAFWLIGGIVGASAGALGFYVISYVLGLQAEPTPPVAPPERDDGTVCYSRDCLAAAEYLRDQLNPLLEPCRNFTDHVCGRFQGPGHSVVELSWRTHLEVMVAAGHHLSGARGKASQLLKQCLLIYTVATSSHQSLRDFMKRLNLFLYSPPPTAPVASDQVLALHVELSYTYGVSGLLRIRPSLARSLSVEMDGVALTASLKRQRDPLHPLDLATIAGVKRNLSLVTLMKSLFDSMEHAVATAAIDTSAQAASALLKQVKDLKFTGVSANAFADAIEAKTVYRRDASVFESSQLMTLLESVWREFSVGAELFLWTSWYVLDELAPFVEKSVAVRTRSVIPFSLACVGMVSHTMAPALAALVRSSQVTSKARHQITTMTNVLASCLNEKTSLISPFATPLRVIVGFPPHADSVERLDAFYATFPVPRQLTNAFFADWAAGADERALRLSADQDHVDVFALDVDVGADGAVAVPAALFALPFFVPDGPVALNVGGLGHLIARRLAQRYLVPNSLLPARCQALASGSEADWLLPNLLAYSCIGHALSALNGSHQRRLPQLAGLKPEAMMYTVGCLKDCLARRGELGRCTASSQGLKGFEDAFSCDLKGQQGPTCTL
ncbi:uncharacterized protein [Dermacentor albipictus]|uniref:uncharacterized protein isoform X2 n=1 Tax=Dermacentor albipictus TaxID=60249 RepID=UPI0031FC3225